ncbi:histidine kinase CKI1-like [Vicia villosa]|uniref:histidine kinase CKI1-like n=1 Tax=Vicia villosa TaxID=3911 RepID=UPI00273BF167|nr:histidine kinase CKI1-like [Vicia villosa]
MALLRPSSFIILLAYGALIVLAALTPCWYVMVTHIQKRANSHSNNIVSNLQSEIEYSAELLQPFKSSSTNLARLLSSTVNSTNITFSDIKTKVAPLLFQALKTIPHLTQISYIGTQGLSFTYYNDDDQVLAMYSNSSIVDASNKTIYYIQPVNRDTGEIFGEALISNKTINIKLSLIPGTNDTRHKCASLGTKLNNVSELLFINSARINKIGVISLGFSGKTITDYVTQVVDRQGTISYLATKDGNVIAKGNQNIGLKILNDSVLLQSLNANGDIIRNEGGVSCKDQVYDSSLNIQDTQYFVQCYPIDIIGVESVYVMVVPKNEISDFDPRYKKKGLILLIVMMVLIFIAISSFLFVNIGVTRREMNLCASLIKQMEATEQAERKNMNKSLAFASASHDLRAYLAGLIGLIEMSSKLVLSNTGTDLNLKPRSELETNFKQMDNCAQDLLGLLNSILDTSKIEAGKMQLEEEEFDLSYLVEDVVDLYYPMAMKKGVELVLDSCNGSVIRYSRVKGDRRKLKQVLCNLLSNAVKFTDEGHITVRAWAQKSTLQKSIIKRNQNSVMKPLSWMFFKKNDKDVDDIEAVSSIQQDTCLMDFVFEVDDTGKGIPKEKYKSVFENYVQVKENTVGQVGTGLGLGIVQSLVRLMHGDIEIVEKEVGKKGTCFKFNVLLSLCENDAVTYGLREGFEYGSTSGNRNQICPSSSPKTEPSHVILYLADEERRRTSQMFIESLGIKVKVVKNRKHLIDTLKKIKKQNGHQISDQSSSESSELGSRCPSYNSSYSRGSTKIPLRALDGAEYVSSMFKMTNNGAATSFVLIIIDANAGPFSKLSTIVTNFKKDLVNPSKVIWLEKPFESSIDFKTIDRDDVVISKPFHGTRLFQVIKFLPEFGGNLKSNSSNKALRELRSQVSSHDESVYLNTKSCRETKSYIDQNDSKPLSGKKFLVIDDSPMLRKIAMATLSSLGVTSIDQCENGKEALKQVEQGLKNDFPNPPYDYILMDCQMPEMDGFEATRKIREMEKEYGVHISIIALSAEIDKLTTETGMDFHITKPIKKEHLLKAITYIENSEI